VRMRNPIVCVIQRGHVKSYCVVDHRAHSGEFCVNWSVADSSRVHYNRVVVDGLTGSLIQYDPWVTCESDS